MHRSGSLNIRHSTSLFALGLLLGAPVATSCHVIPTGTSVALLVTAIPMLASDNSNDADAILAVVGEVVESTEKYGPEFYATILTAVERNWSGTGPSDADTQVIIAKCMADNAAIQSALRTFGGASLRQWNDCFTFPLRQCHGCFGTHIRTRSLMSNLPIFLRTTRSRSFEHQRTMDLLADAGLAGQMIAVLRQELDSMVRVIYLLTQSSERQTHLIEVLINGKKWTREDSRTKITDRDMIDLAQKLQGWTASVHKFGCAFIHLSCLHDYNDRDPLLQLPDNERLDIVKYCRYYHGGPAADAARFEDIVPYLPEVLKKISGNLDCYLEMLESGKPLNPEEV